MISLNKVAVRELVMVKKRSIIDGMTDYTGVSLDDILSHLREWRDETNRSVEALKRLRKSVEKHRMQFDDPDDIIAYVDSFIDLFIRYLGDFDRLLVELPLSVTKAHVEIVQQIYKSRSAKEKHCIRFSQDHIDQEIKDEGLRYLIDDIYRESRGMLIDYYDLSNLIPRLRTFVGTAALTARPLRNLEILELKPNIFGLGVNLNNLVKWIYERLSRRKRQSSSGGGAGGSRPFSIK